MGCSASNTAAHIAAPDSKGKGTELSNELQHVSNYGGHGRPADASRLSSSAGVPVFPSVCIAPVEASPIEAFSGALSARSVGFNETYTPIKLLGKGTYGKVSLLRFSSGIVCIV